MLEIIYSIFLLLLAIPVGYLIAGLAKDELIEGRKWFKLLTLTGFLLGVVFLILGWIPEAFSSLFMGIVSFVSFIKSYDSKWKKGFKK